METLLAPAQFVLGSLALGDVADSHHQPGLAHEGGLAHVDFHPENVSQAVACLPFKQLRPLVVGLVDPTQHILLGIGRHIRTELSRRQFFQIIRAIAIQFTRPLVDIQHTPCFGIQDEQGIIDAIQNTVVRTSMRQRCQIVIGGRTRCRELGRPGRESFKGSLAGASRMKFGVYRGLDCLGKHFEAACLLYIAVNTRTFQHGQHILA